MGQELALPDWAKSGPAAAFSELAARAQEDSLSAGIGQSYGVIGYKGKVWSLRYRGERHNFIRQDDGTPINYIDVIVLKQAPHKSKSYYKQYDQDSAGERPVCSSINGVVPDADAQEKQADACALCPRNVWKTDPNTGRKSRECTDYKRLAVLILPSMTTPLLGSQLLEPVFLRVPPASLNSLAIMGDTMANQGYHYSTYITRISFDPNFAHPQMIFRPLQALGNEEAPVILDLVKDMTTDRIVNGDVALPAIEHVQQPKMEVLPPGSVSTGLSTAARSEGMSSPAGSMTSTVTTEKSSTVSASAPPATINGTTMVPTNGAATSAQSTPAPSEKDAVVTGLGGALSAQQDAPKPASQTLADTGEAEASDADLDARIAGLIKAH